MRGQAALEMLFALMLTLLVFLWFTNYSEAFAKTSYTASVANQQRLGFKAVLSAVNEACVRGVNVTVAAPCLTKKSEDLYYHLGPLGFEAKPSALRMTNVFSNTSETAGTACRFDGPFGYYLRCSETPTLCTEKIGEYLRVQPGVCT